MLSHTDRLAAIPGVHQLRSVLDKTKQQATMLRDKEVRQLREWMQRAETNEEYSSLLFRAIQANASDLVNEVASRKKSLLTTLDETLGTPLHRAVAGGHVEVVKVLLDRGCSLTVCGKDGITPLHLAARKGHVDMVRLLLDRNCTVNFQDQNGHTPLHYAAVKGHVDVVQLLLERGGLVESPSNTGSTPLHVAVIGGHADIATLLLDQRSTETLDDNDAAHMERAIGALVKTFQSPTQHRSEADQRRDRDRVVSTLHALLSRGYPCALALSAVREDTSQDAKLVVAAVRGWQIQQAQGVPLSPIPIEALDGSVQAVQFFFKAMQHQGTSYRKKLCVVGPSRWGKTSFIKSFTSNQPTLELADKRTLGIDLFAWSFDMPRDGHRCDVSVWDFAGQDEYQSAHAMFYSKRTLYVVCVNMDAYVNMLVTHNVTSAGESNAAVDAFFEEMIYRRIRAICAHEPASEFVFVGTKMDLVSDQAAALACVGQDLMARVAARNADEVYQLNRALEELEDRPDGRHDPTQLLVESTGTSMDAKRQHLMLLRRERPKFLSATLVAMSSADLSGVSDVRDELQRCIVASDSSFLMPATFALVAQCLRTMVQRAKELPSIPAQLAMVIVPKDQLCHRVQEACAEAMDEALDLEDIQSILRMLHALGDILWFEKANGKLSTTVFLSPDLVIDFVRNVINHELGEATASATDLTASERAVRSDGRVVHSLLSTLALWRDVRDKTVMLQLKRLLFNFQLAYPDGTDVLQWDSDLIVPTYWRQSSKGDDHDHDHDGTAAPVRWDVPPSLSHIVSWEYEFRTGLPDSLFHQIGVRSYSRLYSWQRSFTRTSFATHEPNAYVTQVDKIGGGGGAGGAGGGGGGGGESESAYACLRIRVCAANMAIAWKQLLWYVVSLEKLLDEYPGLWVVRYAVAADGARYDVDQLLCARRERHVVGGVAGDLETKVDLLPPNMSWFVNKEWNAPETNGIDQAPGAGTAVPSAADPTQEPLRNTHETQFEAIMIANMSTLLSQVDALKSEVAALSPQLGAVQRTVIEASAEHSNYPALWTLTYRNGIVSEYEVALRCQLTGNCYHAPIIVKVPNDKWFGMYGVAINTGLSVLCAVTPDMLGKGALQFMASAAKRQVDRSIEVRGLVGELDCRDNEAVAMETNRTISLDQNTRILRDLLKLAVDGFDPLRMSEISGLECGYWKETGTVVWAHNAAIAAMDGKILCRHAREASAVGHDPEHAQETAYFVGTGPPTLTPLGTFAESVDALPLVASSELDVTLEILGAQDLPNVRLMGVQSPYCKWKLIDAAHQTLAEGKTAKHVRGGRRADWKYASIVQTEPPLTTLDGCTLVCVVKTETMLSNKISDVIGEGSYTFSEKESVAPSTGQRSELDVRLSSRGEFAGLLKIRLRF